jgi:hypothetical protein
MMRVSKQIEADPEQITERMESMVDIEDWEQLFKMYMDQPEFSNSRHFSYAFKILILWRTLSLKSKTHMNRMKEAEYDAEQQFERSSNLFGFGENKDDAKNPEFSRLFYFMSKKIMCQVEVRNKEVSVLTYFPRLPPCFMLSEETKRLHREECDISDSNTKMMDLMTLFGMFTNKMETEFMQSKQFGPAHFIISSTAERIFMITTWVLSIIINIITLIGYKNSEEIVIEKESIYVELRNDLGFVLIGLAGLFLFLWFCFKYPMTIRNQTESYLFSHPGVKELSFWKRFYIWTKMSFVSQPIPVNFTCHILFTALGIWVHPIAMAVNAFLIINISTTTKFVLKAILLHIDQLALTLMLAIFVIFSYTILVVTFFSDMIKLDVEGNAVCAELLSCFFYVLNLGLRNGGGFGDSLVPTNKTDRFIERTLFDISFFFLINVISLNIIFGVIIDTFSQLRENQNSRCNPFLHSSRRTQQLLRLWPKQVRLLQEEQKFR